MLGLDPDLPVYLGIDPGAHGGMAFLQVTPRARRYGACRMPATPGDVWDWFCVWGTNAVAYLEKVQGYIGKKQPGSRAFKFGKNSGHLEMAIVGCDIRYRQVPPATWQRGLGIPCRRKGEGKVEWKNRLKARAQELFPKLEVTLLTADALLLAEYAARQERPRGVRAALTA